MEKARKAVLKAEAKGQIEEIAKIYKKLKERSRARTQIETESLALWLHNLYCAFEDLFKIIARTFENHVTDSSRYHIELLKRMTLPIEGIRPALLSEKSFPLLDRLRGFRHVMRHAYVYDLDESQVRLVLKDALHLKTLYPKEVRSFLKKL